MFKMKTELDKHEARVIGESQAKALVDKPKKASKLTILLLTLIPLIAATSGVAYYIYIYLPNTPNNLLNSAMNKFIQNPQNYYISGKYVTKSIDESDYVFTASTDRIGAQEISITVDAESNDGTTTIRQVGGEFFVNFSGFIDKDDLEKPKVSKEDQKMADFASRTSIVKNQNKWLRVPEFIFFQPSTTNSKITNRLDNFSQESFTLNKYSDATDGVLKYNLTVESNNIYRLAKHMDGDKRGLVTEALLLYEQNNRDFPDAISLNVEVDKKSKDIINATFVSSAFDDGNIIVEIIKKNVYEDILKPQAESVESALGYDFVDSALLFNETFQIGSNKADRQKVADLKAIAMTMQVHKNNTGFYPDRYEIAVRGLDYIEKAFEGVERTFFVDSNGKTIGLNGSLYAYVPERSADQLNCKQGDNCDEQLSNCGQFQDNVRCKKFFVATTLSDGAEFKIVGE